MAATYKHMYVKDILCLSCKPAVCPDLKMPGEELSAQRTRGRCQRSGREDAASLHRGQRVRTKLFVFKWLRSLGVEPFSFFFPPSVEYLVVFVFRGPRRQLRPGPQVLSRQQTSLVRPPRKTPASKSLSHAVNKESLISV